MADSYRAFISYSHADERWASWLQKSLERYRIPKRIRAQASRDLPKRLYPVFRDRSELPSSADLGAALHEALERSEHLIVVCSPAAAKSRWLNAEVEYFIKLGRRDQILCFMVDGSPDSDAEDFAFPPKLIQADSLGNAAEHLAADPRKNADGRKDAFLKIVAGMLGVGIDDLKQRDTQRRQRFLAVTAAGSTLLSVVMIVLAYFAVQARDEAELRREQAQELIGFMLGDLRAKLQPIGRLDVLDAVGEQAMEYFAALDQNTTPTDLLSRGMALRQIGEVRFSQGNLETALESFVESRTVLQRLFDTNPSSNEYLFELGQSEFWVGYVDYERGNLDAATNAMEQYLDISLKLLERDPGNADYTTELLYAHSNLGSVARARWDLTTAMEQFEASIAINRQLLADDPDNVQIRLDLGGGYSWLGSVHLDLGDFVEATNAHQRSVDYWEEIAATNDDAKHKERLANGNIFLGASHLYRGDFVKATDLFRQSHQQFVELTAQDPSNSRWRRGKASAAIHLAEALRYQNDLGNGLDLATQAVDELLLIVQEDDSNMDSVSQLALALAEQSLLLMQQGDIDRGLEVARAAHTQAANAIAQDKGSTVSMRSACIASDAYSQALLASGDAEAGRTVAEEMLQALQVSDADSVILKAESLILMRRAGREVPVTVLEEVLATGISHPRYRQLPGMTNATATGQ